MSPGIENCPIVQNWREIYFVLEVLIPFQGIVRIDYRVENRLKGRVWIKGQSMD